MQVGTMTRRDRYGIFGSEIHGESSPGKNKVFFDEAMEKLADLRFYASRFGGSCDDLLIKQIDLYIAELQQLRGSISGSADNVTRQ